MRDVPVDLLDFTILTPLPGSEDHKNLYQRQVWMDPDMNKYDLEHVTTKHPIMSEEELQTLYHQCWDLYFTTEHVETLMRRAVAYGIKPVRVWQNVMQIHGSMKFEGVHPQQGGYLRRKSRRQRRHGLPLENPLVYYPRRLWEIIDTYGRFGLYGWKLHRLRKRVQKDPTAASHYDLAMTPVEQAEEEHLEMFEFNDAAKAAVTKAKAQVAARTRHAAAGE